MMTFNAISVKRIVGCQALGLVDLQALTCVLLVQGREDGRATLAHAWQLHEQFIAVHHTSEFLFFNWMK